MSSTALNRRSFLKLAFGATAAAAALSRPHLLGSGAADLRLGAWAGVDGDDLLSAYQSRTGQPVAASPHASNEDILKALRDGADYDVVVLTAYAVAQGVDQGLIQPLDRRRLPNFARLAPEFRDGHRPHDPEDAFSAPKAWGTTGILYRTDLIANPPASWADFWTLAEAHPGQTFVIDSGPEVIGAALWKLGSPPTENHSAALREARSALLDLRPRLGGVDSNGAARLATGEGVMALAWSTDAARLVASGVPVGFVIPAEGTEFWEDDYCIPASAGDPAAAHDFINYMLGTAPPAAPQADLPFTRLMAHTPLEADVAALRDDIWREVKG